MAISQALFSPLPGFSGADFADLRLRQAVGGLFPTLDLEDSHARKILRDLKVPTRTVDTIIALGNQAYTKAGSLQVSTMIIQGNHDEAVYPEHTLQLAARFYGQMEYHTLGAGHELLDPQAESWPQILKLVERFLLESDD